MHNVFLLFAKLHPVTVFVEDTDTAVLLIYHWKAKEIFMTTKKSGKTWSISSSAEQIREVKKSVAGNTCLVRL